LQSISAGIDVASDIFSNAALAATDIEGFLSLERRAGNANRRIPFFREQ
jgi:hypothetical protein